MIDVSKVTRILNYVKETKISDISVFLEMLNSVRIEEEVREIIEYAKTTGISNFYEIIPLLETAKNVGVLNFSELVEIDLGQVRKYCS